MKIICLAIVTVLVQLSQAMAGGVMRKIELSCKRNSSGSIREISCQEIVDPAAFKSSMIQVVITSGGFTGMTTAEVNLLNMEGLNTLGQMSCEQ